MSTPAPEPKKETRSSFEKIAQETGEQSVWREFWGFLCENRKWWMIPLVIIFVVFGLLVLLSGTGFAPFIYTLF